MLKSTKLFWILWIVWFTLIWWIFYLNNENPQLDVEKILSKSILSQNIIYINKAFAGNDIDWYNSKTYNDFTKMKLGWENRKWIKVGL